MSSWAPRFIDTDGFSSDDDQDYCHDIKAYNVSAADIYAAHDGLNPFCMGELSSQLGVLVLMRCVVDQLSKVLHTA